MKNNAPDNSSKTLAEYWCEQYQQTRGMPYPGHKRYEWVNLSRLARTYGRKKMEWCIWKFLRSYADDPWVAESQAWSLFALSSRLNGLLLQAREREAEFRRRRDLQNLDRMAEGELKGVVDGLDRDGPSGKAVEDLPLFRRAR